eukprot:10073343-Alexandrium_andersonii.AAC.1
MSASLVGSEMCIRDSRSEALFGATVPSGRVLRADFRPAGFGSKTLRAAAPIGTPCAHSRQGG